MVKVKLNKSNVELLEFEPDYNGDFNRFLYKKLTGRDLPRKRAGQTNRIVDLDYLKVGEVHKHLVDLIQIDFDRYMFCEKHMRASIRSIMAFEKKSDRKFRHIATKYGLQITRVF